MSHVADHVDETQLQAYLDRELEFADPEVRKAVGAHIADCSKCSALLKEVRQVQETSDQLLSITEPPEREAPSFEDIVRRAAERDVETESQTSSFLRAHDSNAADEFEFDIGDSVEDPAKNDLLPELNSDDRESAPADHGATLPGEESNDTDPIETDIREMFAAASGTPIVDRQSVGDEQPEGSEARIPSDEVVFIEPAPPVATGSPHSAPATGASPARSGRERRKRKRRGIRLVALAATIVVAVGIGGWYGHPYLMNQFFEASPTMADRATSVSAQRPSAPRPSAEAERRDVEETSALGASNDTSRLSAVVELSDSTSMRLPAATPAFDMPEPATRNAPGDTMLSMQRTMDAVDDVMTDAGRTAKASEPGAGRVTPSSEAFGWSEITRAEAEAMLGGPLVIVGGLEVDRIEGLPGGREIRVTQSTQSGEPIHSQIASTGEIGDNATLETAEVTSPEGQRPSTGLVRYGNYIIIVQTGVSAAELESLLRRMTVAPEID